MRESNLLSGHGQRTYIQRGHHTQHLRISAVLQKQLSVFYTSQKVYFYPCQHHQQPNSKLNHHQPFLKTQAPSHALVRNCKIPHFLLTQKPCGLSAKNRGKNNSISNEELLVALNIVYIQHMLFHKYNDEFNERL